MQEANLRIHLLGPYQAVWDTGREASFRSANERALLAYLLLEKERPHSRESLGALLWPNESEKQARSKLRVTLYRLRQSVEKNGWEIVTANNRDIRLNTDIPVWVDVWVFEEALQSVDRHDHPHLAGCAQCVEQLREAVDLYRGPFLQGFMLENSQAFLEWSTLRQERLHRQLLETLNALADVHVEIGEPELAEEYARRQLTMEPWREEAHRQLMHILALRGERTAALAQYENCRSILHEELGVPPSDATEELLVRIQDGKEYSQEQKGVQPPPVAKQPAWWRIKTRWVAATTVLLLLLVAGAINLANDGTAAPGSLIVPMQGIYDDFEDTAYEGTVNDRLWNEIPIEYNCIFEQGGGILEVKEMPSLQPSACTLRAKQPLNLPGQVLGNMKAQMQLSDDHNGKEIATVVRMGTHSEDLVMRAECGIFANPTQAYVGFFVIDEAAVPVEEALFIEQRFISYNTWYEVDLQADASSGTFRCEVNGVEVGQYSPLEAEQMAEVIFYWEIGSWRRTGAIGTILVDDVELQTVNP